MTDQANWQQTLTDLAQQLPAATAGLLTDSEARELSGDLLTVYSPNPQTVAWLNNDPHNRLIVRAASRVYGQPLRVVFVNGASVPPAREAEPAPEAPAVGNLALMDLLSKPIWVKHPRYLSLFYQPYFTTFSRFAGQRAFPLWQYLRDRVNDREYRIAWTPAWEVLLKELAELTGYSAQQMTGCWRPCPVFDQALATTGEPIACCLRYGSVGDRSEAGRCRYWAAGIFQLLVEHGLAVVHVIGTASRNTRYGLQIYRKLPLLTPWQVARLEPAAQRAHQVFLGEDLGIDYSVWSQIEAVSLMRLWREDTGLTLATEGDGVLNAYAFKTFFLPTF